MYNNTLNSFSEKELDKLINQSFLELNFNKPKNAKIAESIAAYTLRVSEKEQTKRKSFLKKLSYFQIIIISSVIVVGGILGITTLNKNSKINIPYSGTYNQHSKISSNSKGVPPTNTKSSNKDTNIELIKNNLSRQEIQNNSASYSNFNPSDNTNSTQEKNNVDNELKINNDSSLFNLQIAQNDIAIKNLAIQKPEPIYFNYPVILSPKENDSTVENSRTNNSKDLQNDIPKKKKIKIRRRSNSKEKNKNKTERDRSGKNYKGI
jgi:hypothetical protein